MSRGKFLLGVQKLTLGSYSLTLTLSYNRVWAEYEHIVRSNNYAYCFSPTFAATALRGIVGNSSARSVFGGAHSHANPDPDSNTHCDSNASSDRYTYSCSGCDAHGPG